MRIGALVSCRKAYERVGDLTLGYSARGWDLLLSAGRDRSGATAVEYGIIAAGIAVVIIAAVNTVGQEVSTLFNTIESAVSSASN